MQIATSHRKPNLLRKYRKVSGLKQSEVAKIIGLTNASGLSRWEKGTCEPSFMNVLRLSLLYQVMAEGFYPDQIQSLKQEIQRRRLQVLGKADNPGPAAQAVAGGI